MFTLAAHPGGEVLVQGLCADTLLATLTQGVLEGSKAYVFIFSVSLTKSNKVWDVKLKSKLMHLIQTHEDHWK